MVIKYLSCCGLMEINGLGGYTSPEEALFGMKEELRRDHRGLRSGIIFTSAVLPGHGPARYATNFVTFIEENNLGTVFQVPQFRNKNTGNSIVTYVWVVKPRNLARWFRENE